ncbi:Hypothetical_protein [Hexamita inflata]|uniref:Hypothetical_protein n=1 Tax=Hexamita inflata TaxID=28002 RepID=A0AA86PIE2_9EUKA|nr:Hypothetical protein HINF_LOCUS27246 [Hexamita inflata]
MKKLKVLRVYNNFVSDDHLNSTQIRIRKIGQRRYNISEQKEPSEEELRKANKLRKIEGPNIYLKQQIKNKRKMYLSKFNSFKQEINAITNQLSNLSQKSKITANHFKRHSQNRIQTKRQGTHVKVSRSSSPRT